MSHRINEDLGPWFLVGPTVIFRSPKRYDLIVVNPNTRTIETIQHGLDQVINVGFCRLSYSCALLHSFGSLEVKLDGYVEHVFTFTIGYHFSRYTGDMIHRFFGLLWGIDPTVSGEPWTAHGDRLAQDLKTTNE